ncbi:isochorismate synthase [Pasteurellaceae bacterium LFhippo2]|nr:isochorismate synthase [Pasteurellaceae bacterium LFhippo2]
MPIFNQLKQQLSQKLASLTVTQGLIQLQAEVAISVENAQLLAWLKGQTVFPHFFWQNRDTDQTIVAIGALKHFDDLEQAERFNQTNPYTLIGGLQFNGQATFILPKLLFVKESEKLTAYLNIDLNKPVELDTLFQPLSDLQVLQSNSIVEMKSACDPNCWQHNIKLAIQEIEQYHFSKVVLANAKTLTFAQPINPYDLLFASQHKNLGCYHFLWSETGEQTFVGSTPERLYQRQDRLFYTEALAGTVAVSEDPEETEQNALWLLNDQKNIYENLLVVDDICSHLADCAADIKVGDAQIKRLHNVQHLRRPIHTTLAENVTDSDCLARIHPTAAVAGLPRADAKQFIAEHEAFKRGWYAGTLGYINPNNAEFCVTLRSALIKQNQITVYAGAGIVEGSDPTSEWLEIERKSQAMLGLLKF